MHKKSFAVVGGDKRNIALAELLFKQGHDVKMFGFAETNRELPIQCKNLKETIRNADYIIGPTPCSHNGGALNAPFHKESLFVEDLFRLITQSQVFIAGHVTPKVWDLSRKYNIKLVDMLEREELLVLNAIPTAEGALKIAIEETDITLHNSKIMVIGYGRIGSILCKMLAGLGAKVYAVVNKSHSAALANSAGHEVVHFEELNNYLHNMDVIYNTVPKIILDKSNMHLINKNALVIDLAAPPYGVDAIVGRDLGLKVLFSSSLPGKIAPVTTATYILSTIYQVINGA